MTANAVRAQERSPAVASSNIVVWEDGIVQQWPKDGGFDLEALANEDSVLARYADRGYLLAQLDSIVTDTSSNSVDIYVKPGPLLTVRLVDIRLDSDRRISRFEGTMRTREGVPFRPEELKADMSELLTDLSLVGAVRSKLKLERLDVDYDSLFVDVVITVTDTGPVVVSEIQINDDSRTSASLVGRLAELRVGSELLSFDPQRIRNRLSAEEFIESVGEPQLLETEDDQVVVFIPVKDAAPGFFDLVVGYLPATAGSSGKVVGSGKIELSNVFGGGRQFGLQLNRLPGQVASVAASARDPFVAGTPVGIGFDFTGYQQDSTYSRSSFGVEASYLIATGLRATASLSRDVTRPGQAGLTLVSGQQRIPRANGYFAGVGLRYRNVDFASNPRQGVLVDMNLERGRSTRESSVVVESDTTLRSITIRQQRLRASARIFIPTIVRQAFVLGADANAIVASEYRDSDLFRFGGASTLRGYNEEQFVGNFVGRALAEYRYQLDRTSFAFVFLDAGFVQVPELDGIIGESRFHPGFGLGIQFETSVGFVNASYALNTDDGPTNGKIHIGLSFGL